MNNEERKAAVAAMPQAFAEGLRKAVTYQTDVSSGTEREIRGTDE